jgi:hypothetical protein
VVDNRNLGTLPDGFDAFSLTGIFVFAVDDTLVAGNRLDLPDGPTRECGQRRDPPLESCCGEPAVVAAAARPVVTNNGRAGQFAVVVGETGGANSTSALTRGLVTR